LVEAVHKRLMGERQFGFMLSGGLDSSLIAGKKQINFFFNLNLKFLSISNPTINS